MDMKGSLWASDTTRSVSFEVYQDMGGAHPDVWYKAFNYDTVRSRPITFADLFALGRQPAQRHLSRSSRRSCPPKWT